MCVCVPLTEVNDVDDLTPKTPRNNKKNNNLSHSLLCVPLTEVNDMDDVLALAEADEKVIRLHVPVNEALCVNVLQSAQQLNEKKNKKRSGREGKGEPR